MPRRIVGDRPLMRVVAIRVQEDDGNGLGPAIERLLQQSMNLLVGDRLDHGDAASLSKADAGTVGHR